MATPLPPSMYYPIKSLNDNDTTNTKNIIDTNTKNVKIDTINLPLINKKVTGINIATLPVENGFITIHINAITGPNGSINITKPGSGTPMSFNGLINNKITLGADPFNKIPFIGKESITVLLNTPFNENILINELSYNIVNPINYKKVAIIFLTVYFIVTILM